MQAGNSSLELAEELPTELLRADGDFGMNTSYPFGAAADLRSPVWLGKTIHCQSLEPVGSDDSILGEPQAPVTLVQYGDYSCPRTVRLHRTITAVIERYGSSLVRCVFRFLPTPETSPAGLLAAEAAEAAARSGKFWEMHNRLMAGPNLNDLRFLTWHAAALGLDSDAFQREMNLRIHSHRALRHADGARRARIEKSPVLFVDGHRLDDEIREIRDRDISHIIDMTLL